MRDSDLPRRRVVMKLSVGADSWDELWRALDDIATRVCRGEMRGLEGCSGGPDSGYSYESSEDESVTHESYFAAIARWKEKRDANP